MTRNDDTTPQKTERLRLWLASDVTITAPGWAVALGAAAALALLLVALD